MNVRVPRSLTLSPIARLALFAVTGFGIYRSRRIYDASYGTENTVRSFEMLDRAFKAYEGEHLVTDLRRLRLSRSSPAPLDMITVFLYSNAHFAYARTDPTGPRSCAIGRGGCARA